MLTAKLLSQGERARETGQLQPVCSGYHANGRHEHKVIS
jgi:hypothetical protein